ncbi:MAG: imelysin family protein [Rhodobacteraceae bacterium]|nr:imelysin family protein [Paracoccaceae bacterium]
MLIALIGLAAAAVQAQDATDADEAEIPPGAASATHDGPAAATTIDHDALRQRALGVLADQFGAFRDATAGLADAAGSYCDGDADLATVQDRFAAAWLAWAPLDSYQFGPIQTRGAALSVEFWPDEKNFVGRALREMLKQPPEVQADPAFVAQNSAAAQGLPALELLLYSDAAECPAIVGISGYLAGLASELYDDWFAPGGWADLANAAGPENPVYLSSAEFTKTLYTAINYGLDRVEEVRIARPLGTYEQSFPTRAEAWRSGLTNAIIGAQIDGISVLLEQGFDGAIPPADLASVMTVVAETGDRLDAVGMPIGEAVKDPMTRFRVESLESKVEQLKTEVASEIGPALGVDTGFSAADGD